MKEGMMTKRRKKGHYYFKSFASPLRNDQLWQTVSTTIHINE
jgi:hypothetical protein